MRKRTLSKDAHDAAEKVVTAQGLRYPETTEDFPWGHRALKVPFTEPTGYGLARSGWITASFAPGERVPLDILEQWVEESYRAVAPKRLSAQLDAAAGVARRSSRSRGKT